MPTAFSELDDLRLLVGRMPADRVARLYVLLMSGDDLLLDAGMRDLDARISSCADVLERLDLAEQLTRRRAAWRAELERSFIERAWGWAQRTQPDVDAMLELGVSADVLTAARLLP